MSHLPTLLCDLNRHLRVVDVGFDFGLAMAAVVGWAAVGWANEVAVGWAAVGWANVVAVGWAAVG